jgi:hypothetical protein
MADITLTELRRTLFEVADRVAPGVHDLADQRIGLLDGHRRVVDEEALDDPPALAETGTVAGGQGANVEGVDPLLALLELAFGPTSIVGLLDRPLVLGPEAFAQSFGAPALTGPPGEGADRDDRHDCDRDDQFG